MVVTEMGGQRRSLRDVAVLENRAKVFHRKSSSEATEKCLLIVGSKNCGKSSIIKQFLEKDRGVVTWSTGSSSGSGGTYLLEYMYARQSGKSLVKDICHIWELGSGTTFVSLLPIAIKMRQRGLSVVLVVDLSAPETILHTIESLLQTIKRSLSLASQAEVTRNVQEEDKPYLDPFPIPLVVIGSKYDIFQNMEPSCKRIVCQYLRSLCHTLQADLIFHSNNDASLVKRTRDILLHYGFGLSVSGAMVTDYNKPLRMLAGLDSFSSIQGGSAHPSSLDKYKNSLMVHLSRQQGEEENAEQLAMAMDPATDSNFQETTIDNLCKQKMEELQRMKEERRRRRIRKMSRY